MVFVFICEGCYKLPQESWLLSVCSGLVAYWKAEGSHGQNKGIAGMKDVKVQHKVRNSSTFFIIQLYKLTFRNAICWYAAWTGNISHMNVRIQNLNQLMDFLFVVVVVISIFFIFMEYQMAGEFTFLGVGGRKTVEGKIFIGIDGKAVILPYYFHSPCSLLFEPRCFCSMKILNIYIFLKDHHSKLSAAYLSH